MKNSENATGLSRSYVAVSDLRPGNTIVNLGIIKNIYPNGPSRVFIEFEPMRSINKHRMEYLNTDKLMVP